MTSPREALYDEIRHAIAAEIVDTLPKDAIADLAVRYVSGANLDALTSEWVSLTTGTEVGGST
jgi:hypothetical protein